MPFTHFHLGPALLIGFLAYRYLDLSTFLAASVLVDWRAALVFLGFWPPPRHSWVHTYLGAFLTAAFISGAMMILLPEAKKRLGLEGILDYLDLNQETVPLKVMLASFSGAAIHITLDAFHHPTMHPFYPLNYKPLYGLMSSQEVTLLALSLGVIAVPVYFSKFNYGDS